MYKLDQPTRRLCNLLIDVIFLILFISLWRADGATGFAQVTDPSAITADEVNVIARELWCPLCSGVRLDSCELKACDQMKDVIALKLSEGQDLDQIRAYFLEQYGPQVLGEPPREGFSWLAWILPVAALLGGALVLWWRMARLVRPSVVATTELSGRLGMSDEDAEKLRKELEHYA